MEKNPTGEATEHSLCTLYKPMNLSLVFVFVDVSTNHQLLFGWSVVKALSCLLFILSL